uniref:Uncharacterized protein n=1 Tax=Spongospora subterranea TaxID=70186 RepID=A0A0H5RAP4_9EUKA|eukprot:CRZ11240.1 hypothetical protein [Spongospora subterranea]
MTRVLVLERGKTQQDWQNTPMRQIIFFFGDCDIKPEDREHRSLKIVQRLQGDPEMIAPDLVVEAIVVDPFRAEQERCHQLARRGPRGAPSQERPHLKQKLVIHQTTHDHFDERLELITNETE